MHKGLSTIAQRRLGAGARELERLDDGSLATAVRTHNDSLRVRAMHTGVHNEVTIDDGVE